MRWLLIKIVDALDDLFPYVHIEQHQHVFNLYMGALKKVYDLENEIVKHKQLEYKLRNQVMAQQTTTCECGVTTSVMQISEWGACEECRRRAEEGEDEGSK